MRILIFLLTTAFVFAQRWGYVDTERILEQMPEYKAAQQEIERISQQWQQQLDQMYKRIEEMYQEYRAKEVLMSEEQKRAFQDKIIQAEEEARQFQKEKFGYQGELFRLREEKIKPIQEKIVKAVESFAKEKRINIIVDRSSAVVFLYADPAYDYTDQIIQRLGLQNR